jgi:hypothetical protein
MAPFPSYRYQLHNSETGGAAGLRNPLSIFPERTSTQYIDITDLMKNGALTDRNPTWGCQ